MNQISYLILGMTFYTIEGVIITIFLIAVAIIVILFVISRHKDFLALEAEMEDKEEPVEFTYADRDFERFLKNHESDIATGINDFEDLKDAFVKHVGREAK